MRSWRVRSNPHLTRPAGVLDSRRRARLWTARLLYGPYRPGNAKPHSWGDDRRPHRCCVVGPGRRARRRERRPPPAVASQESRHRGLLSPRAQAQKIAHKVHPLWSAVGEVPQGESGHWAAAGHRPPTNACASTAGHAHPRLRAQRERKVGIPASARNPHLGRKARPRRGLPMPGVVRPRLAGGARPRQCCLEKKSGGREDGLPMTGVPHKGEWAVQSCASAAFGKTDGALVRRPSRASMLASRPLYSTYHGHCQWSHSQRHSTRPLLDHDDLPVSARAPPSHSKHHRHPAAHTRRSTAPPRTRPPSIRSSARMEPSCAPADDHH